MALYESHACVRHGSLQGLVLGRHRQTEAERHFQVGGVISCEFMLQRQ
jgi:hypothetical protein